MAYIKRGFKEIIMNKTIIFDLDGTLTDSEEGILKSVTYALESFGYEIPPHETLLLFLGPPLVDSFQEHCGMALEEAENAMVPLVNSKINCILTSSTYWTRLKMNIILWLWLRLSQKFMHTRF